MVRDLSGSRAILIGNSTYRDPGIPDLPGASLGVQAMRDLLTGELCGWPADRIEELVDVANPLEMALRIDTAIQDVDSTGVVLLYYVGHGQRTTEGQLALTVGDTVANARLLPHTAMLYDGVARILRGCQAATKLVILDCCHAELGSKANYQFMSTDLAEAYPVDGLYFIGASRTHEKAKASLTPGLTYFTRAFIDVVQTGIPGKPPVLQLDQIFVELRGRMLRAGLPQPVESAVRGAYQLEFAYNAAPPTTHVDLEQELRRLQQRLAELEHGRDEPLAADGQHSSTALALGAERERVAGFGRLEDGLRQASDWYLWGPYLSERQWGTVREDYSADGDAWDYLPHDHARSRAYRWGEDGLAGFCDIEQRLCLGLALWNGRDPIVKERAFGLTGAQGNHGEDVKDYWWYLDAIPSHAWNRWRYHYPQRPFPYQDLVGTNAGRNRHQPEYELLDTGAFDDDRYWITEVCYAKADPADVLMTVTVTNAGPETDTLHVLPTAWFRNTWSWDLDAHKPVMEAAGPDSARIGHPFLGTLELLAGRTPDGTTPALLFCENETNVSRLYGADPTTPYPKDGINDHVVAGADSVNPERRGTKCAFWYQLEVPSGGTVELRLRLRPAATAGTAAEALGEEFEQVISARRADADEFYAGLTPAAASADEALVMRQAFAGLLWSKQFYYYDVARWLYGDPAQAAPPPERRLGRNSRWLHFNSFDIMSVPDPWEYPWFAAWDLGFHCVALARLDPGFAKYQLILLFREWFQHPNGALPAYEWDFSDVNPPVQAWAALQVFALDGGRDLDFLSRVFDQLLVNFTWSVNREDATGNDLFSGGFLGIDNIGPIDASHLPFGNVLQQSDAAGWMRFYALDMASIAVILTRTGQRPASDTLLKFFGRLAAISDAFEYQGLWDDADGLYYDRVLAPSGVVIPMRIRSLAGMVPMLATAAIDEEILYQSGTVSKHFAGFLNRQGVSGQEKLQLRGEPGQLRLLLTAEGMDRLEKLFARLFDEGEFLSRYGLRTLSAYHRDHPYTLELDGVSATVGYEPAESTTSAFGGNSNWRGPLWFPLNVLVITSLERYHRFFGDEFTVEYPSGSGNRLPLGAIAADLQDRLISIFTRGPDGRRPCFGSVERLQTDLAWRDNLVFSEYFHGDNGAGLGASHHTGWTGLVADIIIRRRIPEGPRG